MRIVNRVTANVLSAIIKPSNDINIENEYTLNKIQPGAIKKTINIDLFYRLPKTCLYVFAR